MIIKKRHLYVTLLSPNEVREINATAMKYQNSAMEYAIWYQDCLLRMEDVLVKRLEAKIEVILDRKILEYIEKTRNKNNSIIHL